MNDLAFEDTGSGTPVVFLHGIAMNRSAWRPVTDILADRYRCVNVDLAGHGESPHTGAYDVFSQATAVGELISGLDLERPVVVGHSYGGFTGTLLGATAAVRGVVNIDQELDTASFKRTIAPFESRLRGGDFDAAIMEFALTLRPEFVPDERQAEVAITPDRDVVLGVWNMVFDTPADELNAMVEPVLSSYPVPYLVILNSEISPEERRLLELIPDVEIEHWTGLGHFIQLVDPERTAARVTAFVERVS